MQGSTEVREAVMKWVEPANPYVEMIAKPQLDAAKR
jgi:hypothetical protein